jgi:hypothetical protein
MTIRPEFEFDDFRWGGDNGARLEPRFELGQAGEILGI